MSIKLVLIFAIHVVNCDKLQWGACPKVDVMTNFDFNKMLGKWHVIQKSETMSSCITLEFKKDEKKGLFVEESLKPLGISIPKFFEKFKQIGKLRIPNKKYPGQMKVSFPFSLIPYSEVDFTIIDTDYVNYAAIWSCRSLFVGHRQSAMILGRDNKLPSIVTNRLRERYESYGIDKHSLSIVYQNNCYSRRKNSTNEVPNNV